MLIRSSEWECELPTIRKRINGNDLSARGSFAYGECPEFVVEVPRKLGASAVVMRINKDGCADSDYPFSFRSTDGIIDVYSLTIDTAALCREDGDGLFFYELLFLRGFDTLFTSSSNNVDFELSRASSSRFTMLVCKKGFDTPEWMRGRTMYQIFVDRFFKGEGSVGKRDDVVINPDWDNGIPQYVERQGEDISNNEFFGGNLWGVAEKIDYLKSLGVGVIYLNPIFKAYSNHKYDTGDYMQVDQMFGGDEAFDHLVKKANEADIKIMLDGVFNHTGDNSLYFDRYKEYGGVGAYGNESSPYRNWFSFKDKKDEYDSWWGIKILPRLNHKNEECRRFFTSPEGVGAHYIKKGVAAWRLDVADELCDEFLDEFTDSVKAASNGEAVVLGEVWENAATKIAYGTRRRYLRGSQLDSVMNYPLRSAILAFVINKDAKSLSDTLKMIYSSYPKSVCDSLMNILGTHDTERILTVLGKQSAEVSTERGSKLARKRLSESERASAIKKLMIAASVQYTVYGVPSLYYGDEAGLEGYRDPFCRMPYPWGREEPSLLGHYARLGEIRAENRDIFADGDFRVLMAKGAFIAYSRRHGDDEIIILANASGRSVSYSLSGEWRDLRDGSEYKDKVAAYYCAILKKGV